MFIFWEACVFFPEHSEYCCDTYMHYLLNGYKPFSLIQSANQRSNRSEKYLFMHHGLITSDWRGLSIFFVSLIFKYKMLYQIGVYVCVCVYIKIV